MNKKLMVVTFLCVGIGVSMVVSVYLPWAEQDSVTFLDIVAQQVASLIIADPFPAGGLIRFFFQVVNGIGSWLRFHQPVFHGWDFVEWCEFVTTA